MLNAFHDRLPSRLRGHRLASATQSRPFLGAAALVILAGSGLAAPQAQLLSAANEPQLGANAEFCDASDDGRFVLFESGEPNLVPGQVDLQFSSTNDLFLYDRDLGTVRLVTHAGDQVTANLEGDNIDTEPVISGDGSLVVFATRREDLVAGYVASPNIQIYAYDVATGNISLVSKDIANPLAGASRDARFPTVDGTGSVIVYRSDALNLVDGFLDQNGNGEDVYAYDVATGTNALISRSYESPSDGGNGDCNNSTISHDGSTVVFQSTASNLIDGFFHSGPIVTNVFAHDLLSGDVTLISEVAGDPLTGADALCLGSSVNEDGSMIAFGSRATNLVSGYVKNNGPSAEDLYIWDAGSGSLTLVTGAGGSGTDGGNGDSEFVQVSADGSALAFHSTSTDLLPGVTDGNGGEDLFHYDVATGTVTLVSRSAADANTTADLVFPSGANLFLAADGSRVVYGHPATNLVSGFVEGNDEDHRDVFVFDVALGMTSLVSHAEGFVTTGGNGFSQLRGISADASTIFFRSDASDIVDPVVHSSGTVMAYDVATDTTEIASPVTGTPGETSNSEAELDGSEMISDDGRFVLFDNQATNLLPGYVHGGSNDSIYLYDLQDDSLRLVNHTGDGVTTSDVAPSNGFAISGDGSTVVFQCRASNLIPGFVGPFIDQLYLYDVETGTIFLASHTVGNPLRGGEGSVVAHPSITPDGLWVAYTSNAHDLVDGLTDENGDSDIFLYDVANDTHTLVSHVSGSPLTTANGRSRDVRISRDGQTIVFESLATNLVAGFIDNNGSGGMDVYSYDVATGVVSLVSRRFDNPLAGGESVSFDPEVGNGGVIVFESGSTDLVDGFVNNNGTSRDVFLSVMGVTTLVSHAAGSTTEGANGFTRDYRVSGDGSTVVYTSNAGNLISGFVDTNGFDEDVFTYDVATDTNLLVSHVPGEPTMTGDGRSGEADINRLGDRIVYESQATNLAAGQVDNNTGAGDEDVFVYDAVTGSNMLVSHLPGFPNETSNQESEQVSISADGTVVAYETDADDMVANDFNNEEEVFAYTLPVPGCTPEVYCTSVGAIAIEGAQSLAANDTVLTVSGVPNDFGIFIMGQEQGALQNPICGAAGTLCIDGQITRLCPELMASGGTNSLSLDFTDAQRPEAVIVAGESWNFQYWYRMPGGCSFSDAISACFVP